MGYETYIFCEFIGLFYLLAQFAVDSHLGSLPIFWDSLLVMNLINEQVQI